MLLGEYIQSIFQDFESYLRAKVDLAKEDIDLTLRQYLLNFITCETPLGVFTTGDVIEYFDEISKAGSKIENEGITMKTELFEKSINLGFGDKSFFNTFLGFS